MLRLNSFSLLVAFALAGLDLAAEPAARRVLFHVRLIELDSRAQDFLADRSATTYGPLSISMLDASLDIVSLFEEVRANGAQIHFLAATNIAISNNRTSKVFEEDQVFFPSPQAGGHTTVQKPRIGMQLELQPTLAVDGQVRVTVRPSATVLTRSTPKTGGPRIAALSTRAASANLLLAPGQSFWIAGLSDQTVQSTLRMTAKRDPLIRFIAQHPPDPGTHLVLLVTAEIIEPVR